MRTISRTSKFKADFRQETRGKYRETVAADLKNVVAMLVADEILPRHYQDHRMLGQWSRYRNCHIKPDLILLYRRLGERGLELTRLGSHSELRL